MAFTSQKSEELIFYNLVLDYDNFKPGLESGIFKCTSWLNGSFFGGDDRGFLKDGVKTYQMSPMSPIKIANFFSAFTSVVYCFRQSSYFFFPTLSSTVPQNGVTYEGHKHAWPSCLPREETTSSARRERPASQPPAQA